MIAFNHLQTLTHLTQGGLMRSLISLSKSCCEFGSYNSAENRSVAPSHKCRLLSKYHVEFQFIVTVNSANATNYCHSQ